MAFIILTFSIISFISMGISQQMYGQKLQLALKEYGGFSQALIQIKDSEYNKYFSLLAGSESVTWLR